jgi:hypothetical protein
MRSMLKRVAPVMLAGAAFLGVLVQGLCQGTCLGGAEGVEAAPRTLDGIAGMRRGSVDYAG